MDKFIKELPVSALMTLWGGNGEVTLNDLVAAKIKAYLKDYPNYSLLIRKSISNNNIPDLIITKDGKYNTIFEFKKGYGIEDIKGALCQMLCYIARTYSGIVPFNKLVVWTPRHIITFSWNNLELLYENFKLYYDNSTPSKYWKKAPLSVKLLFKSIDRLWDSENLFNDALDFNYFTKTLIA